MSDYIIYKTNVCPKCLGSGKDDNFSAATTGSFGHTCYTCYGKGQVLEEADLESAILDLIQTNSLVNGLGGGLIELTLKLTTPTE